jgi:DNA polymerase
MGRTVDFDGTFEGWRAAAGDLLRSEAAPELLYWPDPYCSRGQLFDGATTASVRTAARQSPVGKPVESAAKCDRRSHPMVPPARWNRFLQMARRVCYVRFAGRFALLYRVAWRMRHGEPDLPELATDPDMLAIRRWDNAVRRDAHKTKAFVRFRLMHREHDSDIEHFAAWHRPQHYPLRLVGGFFADRFAPVRWAIFTPDEAAMWDGQKVQYIRGCYGGGPAAEDPTELLWRIYYSHIFNPARVNVAAMRREMPKHHWQTLPEARDIPDLLREAGERAARMRSHTQAPRPQRKPRVGP